MVSGGVTVGPPAAARPARRNNVGVDDSSVHDRVNLRIMEH